MEIQIALTSTSKSLEELKEALQSQPGFIGSEAQLEIKPPPKKKFRSIDPTLVVAIVGAAGPALAALITGLFQFGQKIAAKKYVLETHDGNKLEVPANTSAEEIGKLLKNLGQMSDVKKISVE
jgi:hypothetical protein